jgi:hypothetical protein
MAFLRSSTARASELAGNEALRLAAWDRWRLLAATLSVLTLVWSRDLPAAEGSRAASIKAAFIFNFVQFTEWPEDAFADKEAPLVIGVLGSNPFGDVLETTVTNEVVRGRRLVVEHYNGVAEIKTCHILYIGQSEGNRLGKITEALKGKPVLTVSDIENSAARRIIIELMTSQNRIRFRINLEAARAANLSMSSKLLRAGEIAKQ